MLIEELLFESRKNPDLNPKISATAAVKPYQDDYITFTDINKVGINPSTTHDTPLGIYCYPVKYIWKQYNITKSFSLLPFASNRKYVHVLRPKHLGREILVTEYSSSHLENDLFKLRHKYQPNDARKQQIQKLISGLIKQHNITVPGFDIFKQPINPLIFDFYADNIQYNKVTQELKHLVKEYNNLLLNIDKIIDESKAKHKDPFSVLWNTTRILGNYGSESKMQYELQTDDDFVFNSMSAQNWNKILRDLRITLITDPGKGIIHPNEPTQALFLSLNNIELINTFYNKDY